RPPDAQNSPGAQRLKRGMRGPEAGPRASGVLNVVETAPGEDRSGPTWTCVASMQGALVAGGFRAPLLGGDVAIEAPQVRHRGIHVDRIASSPKVHVPVQGGGAARVLGHRPDGIVPAAGHRRAGIVTTGRWRLPGQARAAVVGPGPLDRDDEVIRGTGALVQWDGLESGTGGAGQ